MSLSRDRPLMSAQPQVWKTVTIICGDSKTAKFRTAAQKDGQTSLLRMILGTLQVIAVCQLPGYLAFEDRLSSFALSRVSPQTAELAGLGLCWLSGDVIRCFGCGCQYKGEVSSSSVAGDAVGSSCAKWCTVRRLLKLEDSTAAAPDMLDQRFQRVLTEACRLLDSQACRMALDFGYSKEEILFASLRLCLATNPADENGIWRPLLNGLFERTGGIISCMHEFNAQWLQISSLQLDFLSLAADCTLTEFRDAAVAAAMGAAAAAQIDQRDTEPLVIAKGRIAPGSEAAQAEAAAVNASSGESETDSASGTCQVCRQNQLNRVCLPCRHLVMCSSCLSTRSQCPRCSAAIIASVQAFLT